MPDDRKLDDFAFGLKESARGAQSLQGGLRQTRSEIDKLMLYKGTDAGKTVTFKYRVVVHPGDAKSAGLDEKYKEYAAMK